MAGYDWQTSYARAVAVFLNGDAITEPDPRGEPVRDDSFLLLLSAHHEPLTFTLPGRKFGRRWAVVADTAADPAGTAAGQDDARAGADGIAAGQDGPGGTGYRAGERVQLAEHSMMVLRRTLAATPRGGTGGSSGSD